MIRYYPASVSYEKVQRERRKHTWHWRQSPETIQRRAAASRKCLCLQSMNHAPDAAARVPGCPLRSGSRVNSVAAIQGLGGHWSDVRFSRRVELMMHGGHPVMSALHLAYYASEVHLIFTLCPHPQELRAYLTCLPLEYLFLRDSMGNTAFLLLVASPCRAYVIANVLRSMDGASARRLVRKKNCEGLAPLHFAVLRGNCKLIRLLLSHGADVNAGAATLPYGKFGITPFHLSLLGHSQLARECFSELLKNKADAGIEALTPARVGDPAVGFRFECDCGGCWSTPVQGFGAVLHMHALETRPSVSMGAALNILASFRDQRVADFVRILLKYDLGKEVDVNKADHRGLPPLAHAVLAQNEDLVKLLMARYPRVSQPGTDADGFSTESPLELARMLVGRGERARVPRRRPATDSEGTEGADREKDGPAIGGGGAVIYEVAGYDQNEGGGYHPVGAGYDPSQGAVYGRTQGGVCCPQGAVCGYEGATYVGEGACDFERAMYDQLRAAYHQQAFMNEFAFAMNGYDGALHASEGKPGSYGGAVYGRDNAEDGFRSNAFHNGTAYGQNEVASYIQNNENLAFDPNEDAAAACAEDDAGGEESDTIPILERIRQLDDNTCPWCQRKLLAPRRADNVAQLERHIRDRLEEVKDLM